MALAAASVLGFPFRGYSWVLWLLVLVVLFLVFAPWGGMFGPPPVKPAPLPGLWAYPF